MSIFAPYMSVQTLPPSNDHYDIVEGQWMCTDMADATYYCLHNWYHATGEFAGIVDGSGYAGFQCRNNSPWVIMSLWANEHGFPTIEYAPPGSIAKPFSGEGTGCQVLSPFPWIKGKWYTMRVQAKSGAGKTTYEQWIKGEEFNWIRMAAISYPKPGLGFTWDCFFLEDWIGNDLLRSCQLRGYYARKTSQSWLSSRQTWVSLDRFTVYNHLGTVRNTLNDCGFGAAGTDKIWISSGGGFNISLPAMPHELRIRQGSKPATTEVLG